MEPEYFVEAEGKYNPFLLPVAVVLDRRKVDHRGLYGMFTVIQGILLCGYLDRKLLTHTLEKQK